MQNNKLMIITGMSGAGKSVAMDCFEDQGYYCVDNLPPSLIPKFVQLCNSSKIHKLAIAMDIRGREFFDSIQNALDELPPLGFTPFILFLEAEPEVLIRRYAESRRQHPLAENDRVAHGIEKEREHLVGLRAQANLILDTSDLTPHKFRALLQRRFSDSKTSKPNNIHVLSFGFKYGIPLDVDLVFDCRFLPNPYYISDLKRHTGLEKVVKDYIFSFEASNVFIEKIMDILEFLLPKYYDEGKQHLTIAFGCTGGCHRSTALAERVTELLKQANFEAAVEHRDLQKARKGEQHER